MKYGHYKFICQLDDKAFLPAYKGSTLRGFFGHALKRVACTPRRRDCEACLLNTRCAYPLFFETHLFLDFNRENARQAAPPKPFVLETPLAVQREYNPGEPIEFGLVLFGRANEYLPYLVYAFKHLGELGIGKKIEGRRARFTLTSVLSGNDVIYSAEDDLLKPADLAELNLAGLSVPENDAGAATLCFETPLRSKFQNRLTAELPFHILIRTLLRRISSLESTYGQGEPDIDYSGLTRTAESIQTTKADLHWFDWQRYSSRQDRKMWMGGLVGSITYSGALGRYMPLLEYGRIAHIGKQTTFGLGKYRLE